MIGVGLAEAAGLIGSLIRKLVSVSSEALLTPIIIFIGVLSSIASDAGYLVLIPLGAAAFKSVGRNPLAGMAAAFAGRRRGVRRQLPDHAARRRADRDHERRERPRRPRPLDRPRGEPLLRHRLDDPRHDRPDARLRVHRRARPRQARPRARVGRRVARCRQGPRGVPGGRRERASLRALRDPGGDRRDHASHRVPRRAAARPGHGRHHRRLAVHGQPDRDHHDHLLRGRARLWPWSRDDPHERRGARVDHEVVGRPRESAVPVPPDRAVHRVLQLLEHGAGGGREARRLARGGQHRSRCGS